MPAVAIREGHSQAPQPVDGGCPVCDGEPVVLVAMQHPVMLRFTRELLQREFRCWISTEAETGAALCDAVQRSQPDLVIIDAANFPRCCLGALDQLPPDRVIVIGPEPDRSYRAAALTHGAAAWLPRDRVGEDLASEMRRVLGCIHDPCPPGEDEGANEAHTAQTARRHHTASGLR